MSFRGFIAPLGLLLAFSTFALGQAPQKPSGQGESARPGRFGGREGFRRHEGRGHRGKRRPMLRALGRELGLTEAQQQQLRGIHERQFENTKAQREELLSLREKRQNGTFTDADEARAKELRQQLRSTMEGTHNEVLNVLTTEQRARLDELKAERKARREERRERRREFKENNQ